VTASFFNIDILTTFEDEVIFKTTGGGEDDEGDREPNGDAQEMRPVEANANANGEPRVGDGEEHYGNVEV
jgi:hypothetical protein